MKSLPVYFLAIATPLVALILLLITKGISSLTFALLLLIWALIYRPITDGKRLIEKGVIQKKDIWKLFLPFYRYKWINELYFQKQE
jgi:hypothetical protein